MLDNFYNKYVTNLTRTIVQEMDKRMFEILDGYFGKIPRDKDKLIEWIQEKRNQGYLITHGEDLSEIGRIQGKTIHWLTIKYDKEIVLKEILLTVDINTIFEEVK
jgi:hypothetical protein